MKTAETEQEKNKETMEEELQAIIGENVYLPDDAARQTDFTDMGKVALECLFITPAGKIKIADKEVIIHRCEIGACAPETALDTVMAAGKTGDGSSVVIKNLSNDELVVTRVLVGSDEEKFLWTLDSLECLTIQGKTELEITDGKDVSISPFGDETIRIFIPVKKDQEFVLENCDTVVFENDCKYKFEIVDTEKYTPMDEVPLGDYPWEEDLEENNLDFDAGW